MVLYRPIFMEDISAIYFIFFLNMFYLSMTRFLMMMGNPQNIGKTPSFSHIIGFLAKWHIVDFNIRPIGFFWNFFLAWTIMIHFVLYRSRLTEILRTLFVA